MKTVSLASTIVALGVANIAVTSPVTPAASLVCQTEFELIAAGYRDGDGGQEVAINSLYVTPPKAAGNLPEDNDLWTIPLIHKSIVERLDATSEAEMRPFTNTIPGTRVKYVMVPIPGGEFMMGSPEAEPGRKPDEGPRHKVKIQPFWMGKFEVTWNEYDLFVYPKMEELLPALRRAEKQSWATAPTNAQGSDAIADAIAHPSAPISSSVFGMEKDGYPAIAMTQHAANKYCHWLSAKTGQFYRLPTEAEWEYACRAGTTTAYSFGEDPGPLADYGWYFQNSGDQYQKVGKKKPNAWGLYDMHGNVLEWCLDQYAPDYYRQSVGQVVQSPWNKATEPYPHAVRGGSWEEDDPVALRSAARRGSERAWKMTDPQLPKSYWWVRDAPWIGFRIIRPLKVPSPDEMKKYWISGVEKD